mgnify:CR=1 FL=1
MQKNYSRFNETNWGSFQSRVRFYIFSNTLKRALKLNLISLDLIHNGTDELILKNLELSKDPYISKRLKLLKNNLEVIPSKSNNGGIYLPKKFRYVDPGILVGGEVIPLSLASSNYKSFLESKMDAHETNYLKLKNNNDLLLT